MVIVTVVFTGCILTTWVPGLKLTAPKVGNESELPPRLVPTAATQLYWTAPPNSSSKCRPALPRLCDPPPPPQASREAAYTKPPNIRSVPRYNTEIQSSNKDYSGGNNLKLCRTDILARTPKTYSILCPPTIIQLQADHVTKV